MNTDNSNQLKEISESDFEIADGEPNIKGWKVKEVGGKRVGEVDDLIFNQETYKVLYLIVDLDDNEFGLDEDKKVLVPIGLAELHEKDDEVILPAVTAAQLSALPAYEKGNITEQTEAAVRSIFAGGAVAGIAATGLAAETHPKDFYQHNNFDDSKFYNKRQPSPDTIAIIEEKMQVGKREVETGGLRLKSRIVEQKVEENINLRTEHVHVAQTSVNRPATQAELDGFKDSTIEMKEHAEVPVISKEAFVTGEVSLGKEVEENTQTIDGTIRKTEVDTENFTDESTNFSNDAK